MRSSPASREELARVVVDALRLEYRAEDLNNKSDPLDELVFIVISQMTTAPSYERVYDRLKATFPTWDNALAAGEAGIRQAIADAGLARRKASALVRIF